ncbi:MAG: enoyl-CoA hydratase/isomerase family protein [Ilumatobacteraceae bacterium]
MLQSPGSLPVIVCWVGDVFGGDGPEEADLVIGAADVVELAATVDRNPLAATTLAVLLRSSLDLTVAAALAQESAAYSMLQAGPEFAAWRAATTSTAATDNGPSTISIERHDDDLVVTLDRPQRHNAITTRMRDELCEALAIAVADDSIRRVVLRGRGPSFCSGGDLSEFGSRTDPATAHITRLAQSPARLLHQLRDRLSAEIHGNTLGGGIEMAAFASRVVALRDTSIGLPEVGLGLIPGAGGTVSVPRRIGRQRTAALALTDRRINAETAREWGLVDEIVV